ncbi:hypothetical protein CUMW_115720, partial [Citrus unshiu]
MKRLENVLFGSLYDPIEFGKEDEEKVQDEAETGSAMYFVDPSANSMLSINEDDAQFSEESDYERETWQKKPAWVDEEEENTIVNIAKVNRLRKLRKEEDKSLISGADYVSRLRAQHVKLNSRDGDPHDESSDEETGAVVARGHEDVEAVDDILRTDEDLVVKSSAKLSPGLLEFSRLVDANAEDSSNGPINSVQFHRNAQFLLIDGKRNTKIQSIFLEECPVRKASFLPDGSHVIIAGRRKFFYSLELVKAKVGKIGPLVGREEESLEFFEVLPDPSTIAFVGNEGYILLVSSKTKELIGTLKMNGTVRSLAFANGGKQLLSSGGDGQVYHWDLITRMSIHKARCINDTALCTSPDGAFFAAGSDSGMRKAIKAIENRTTKVDFMKFNNGAQILAICSTMKKNSLKLIHVPSYYVFSNWPPPNRNLQYPRCLDFGPGGGFMAVENAAGKVLLYKLHHYHH